MAAPHNGQSCSRSAEKSNLSAPDKVQCYAAFVQGNPMMGLPEPLHGKTLLSVIPFYSGDIEAGREVLRPIREFGDPVADTVEPTLYTVHQQSADDLYREGDRNYWKSHMFDELSDNAIDTIVEHVKSLPTPLTTVFFEWMGGAIAKTAPDATAFPHRNATVSFTIAPKWIDPGRDDELLGWAREFFEATAPYGPEDVYVNLLSHDEPERVRDAYGERYERLREVKREWDPNNFFQMNQNIEPAE